MNYNELLAAVAAYVVAEDGYARRWPAGTRGSYTFQMNRAGLDWLGETLGITIHDEEE